MRKTLIRLAICAIAVWCVVAYGINYGQLRDAGVPPGEARVRALGL